MINFKFNAHLRCTSRFYRSLNYFGKLLSLNQGVARISMGVGVQKQKTLAILTISVESIATLRAFWSQLF